MGNNKKNIIIAAVLAMFSTGFNPAIADSANSLLQMDVKKSSVENTVDVTFYTTGEQKNSVVTRKANNRYVVLLPNVSSSASVAPGIGGVKDLITDIDVKHVNDGIGGYTKVTFGTTKPINIKTHMKKTNPLTQAQKDSQAIIAKNNTPKPAAQQTPAKPVANSTPAKTQTTNTRPTKTAASAPAKPSAAPKIALFDMPKAKTQPVKPKAETKKPVEQKTQPKLQPKVEQPKAETKLQSQPAQTNSYVPKMKFDENGRRMIDLEPRVSHSIVTEQPSKPMNNPLFDVNEPVQNIQSEPLANVEQTETAVETPDTSSRSSKHIPIWILAAGGSVMLLGILYLVFDAMKHANEKDQTRLNSFFKLSSQNQAKRRRREYYDIVNNEELNWQEKYKLYTEKEERRKVKKAPSAMSYVTDMSGLKKAVIEPEKQPEVAKPQEKIQLPSSLQNNTVEKHEKSHDDIVREKLQAKISQMEHSLAQTPTLKEPEEVSNSVKSEDDVIMNKISDVKLKSFSKPIGLKEANRILSDKDKKSSRNKSYKEGRFVKLKNSPLSVNRRQSAATDLNISDLIGTGNKYLTNNGEMKMNKEKENYLLSSLDEYLSILDTEEKPTVADTLAKVKSSNSEAMSRSGVTNPISRGSNPMAGSNTRPYMNGLIVKSGYNIDSEKGFYVVNIDGVSALVGRIKDSIFVLKKFDHVVDKPIQVRPDDNNVYIVRVGKFKCLVDVSKDKMGTLIEI